MGTSSSKENSSCIKEKVYKESKDKESPISWFAGFYCYPSWRKHRGNTHPKQIPWQEKAEQWEKSGYLDYCKATLDSGTCGRQTMEATWNLVSCSWHFVFNIPSSQSSLTHHSAPRQRALCAEITANSPHLHNQTLLGRFFWKQQLLSSELCPPASQKCLCGELVKQNTDLPLGAVSEWQETWQFFPSYLWIHTTTVKHQDLVNND